MPQRKRETPVYDNTPVVKYGGIYVKREDQFTVAGVNGGKARAILTMLTSRHYKGVVTCGSRSSNQIEIVAAIAKHLGLPCRVHVASGEWTSEITFCANQGASIIQHKPGYSSVIKARAKADVAARKGWFEVPFGLQSLAGVACTANEVARTLDNYEVPNKIFRRFVAVLGGGVTVAGITRGLYKVYGCLPPNLDIIGVQVGGDPKPTLREFAAPGWEMRVTLVQSPLNYTDKHTATLPDGTPLDPFYEAKALRYCKPGDLFWVVGRRPH